MLRWVERIVFVGLVAAILLVAADWLVWRVRVSRGDAFGTVTVSRMVVAPLKGNREEYYADGTTEERCSRSMLPWGGARACWWVERRRVVMDR